ncbi:unnamed protein product [Menidia menidia]|uniref:(Atlantic silverside) hypothetical protein n=1 Tax=Menidia menidia TaxID=238744 RepID=A0A8S4AR21_9TELE|nr:unnamed protein product [Menidia menidia]
MERPWTVVPSEWMKLERADAPGEDSANAVADSPLDPEVATTVTEATATGVMVTEALAATGVSAAVATEAEEVEVIPQEATEKTGDRVDTATALDPTAMHMTAMLHTSKHLPDSRSSLGWLYLKDAPSRKMSSCFLLTFSSVVVAWHLQNNVAMSSWSLNHVTKYSSRILHCIIGHLYLSHFV